MRQILLLLLALLGFIIIKILQATLFTLILVLTVYAILKLSGA